MSHHWKTLVWFAIVVLTMAIVAFALRWYVAIYAIAFASAVIWFVLTVAWMDEARPARRRRPARR